jgi:hypothetical protein
MGDPTAAPARACAHPCARLQQYVDRLTRALRNDRFEVSETRAEADLAYRRGWNAASEHVEMTILQRVVAELAVMRGLDELEERTR